MRSAEGGIRAFGKESGEPASLLLLFRARRPPGGYFEGLAGLGALTDEG